MVSEFFKKFCLLESFKKIEIHLNNIQNILTTFIQFKEDRNSLCEKVNKRTLQ